MTTKSTTNNKTDELSELEQLKQKLLQMEKFLEEKADNTKSEEIAQDDYIKVMSLLPYTLTLSTREKGEGKHKKFTEFGEIKNILFRDLIDIIDVHPSFTKSGYFYIMNKSAVEMLGLKDEYKNILDKSKIEKILETKDEECVDIFESAQPRQQRIIIELITQKIKEDSDSVNLNIIDKISRSSGIDIKSRVEDIKRFEEILKND